MSVQLNFHKAQREHRGSSQVNQKEEKVGQGQEPNHLRGKHQLGVFQDGLVH